METMSAIPGLGGLFDGPAPIRLVVRALIGMCFVLVAPSGRAGRRGASLLAVRSRGDGSFAASARAATPSTRALVRPGATWVHAFSQADWMYVHLGWVAVGRDRLPRPGRNVGKRERRHRLEKLELLTLLAFVSCPYYIR